MVGGSFNGAGGRHTSGIALWNGVEWEPLGSGIPIWLACELTNSRMTQIFGFDSVP